MALNLVFLAAVSGETNNYATAAALAKSVINNPESSSATKMAFAASFAASSKVTDPKAKEPARGATATTPAAPKAAENTSPSLAAGLSQVPDAINTAASTAANDVASPLSLSNSTPGNIADLIKQEDKNRAKAASSTNSASADATLEVIAATEASTYALVKKITETAQHDANLLTGYDPDKAKARAAAKKEPETKLLKNLEKLAGAPVREKVLLNGKSEPAGEKEDKLSLKGIEL